MTRLYPTVLVPYLCGFVQTPETRRDQSAGRFPVVPGNVDESSSPSHTSLLYSIPPKKIRYQRITMCDEVTIHWLLPLRYVDPFPDRGWQVNNCLVFYNSVS